MNWKYTALGTGATVVATWLAAAPAVQPPLTTAGAPLHPAAQSADAAVDIVRQADRLHARLNAAAAFSQPSRNPFRFNERTPERAASLAPAPVESLTAAPQAPTLRFTLSGIAENTVDGKIVRTAIISMPNDVVLVKEGDPVAGEYTVTSIAADSIELTRLPDNAAVRLALKP
jgi:hypothetical protein